MPIFASAGSKLYIGTTMEAGQSDLTESDFTAQAAEWVEIDPVENLGTLGDTATEVTFEAMGYARTQKLKGTRNAGTMEVVAGLDTSNPGQLALLAAEKTNHNYAFRLVFNDAPPGGTPSERLWVAMVMSASETYDVANSVMKLNASLAINSNVVRVAAAEA